MKKLKTNSYDVNILRRNTRNKHTYTHFNKIFTENFYFWKMKIKYCERETNMKKTKHRQGMEIIVL